VRVSRRLHVPHDLQVRAVTIARADGVALTDEQQHAVARRAEPLLLSAAAGSGKTSVLVERFVAAVREDGIAPARILAITFTERAAGELRARVRARLLALDDREAARDTEAAFVGTFHSFCARLLRAHSLAAGLDPAFTILDEGLAGRLRELAFAASLRGFLADERGEAVDLLAAYGVDRVRGMIEQAHAELRSRGQLLPRLPAPRTAPTGEIDGRRPGPRGADPSLDGDSGPDADPRLDADAARACALLDELLERFGLAYARLKSERAAVDFDDLELLAGELLTRRDGVRATWSERFELLMVDEFQDTNPRQLAILQALDRGNLFTVGDELQSIYGFRHADVSLFRARHAELQELGRSIRLTRNFRSRESLLDIVNAVFAGRFPGYTPLVAGRRDDAPLELGLRIGAEPGAQPAPASGPASGPAAESATERGAEPAPAAGSATEPAVELLLTDVRGWDEREDLATPIAAGLAHTQLWRQAEARLLAQRVAELVHEGRARPGEVVVLLRAAGDLEVFERALQLQGLRTLAAVGAFWGHQQIGDLLSYLRALANPLDELALYSVLASPLGGCSRDCLALLGNAARAERRGVWETALGTVSGAAEAATIGLADGDRAALASFCAGLQAERQQASLRTLSELIERAIDASGYRAYVLELDWPERRLANVHKLLRLARRFEASEGRDLRGFLDHVEYLERAVKVEPDAPVEGVEPDAVRLMTIHAAKGLEFPVVCLADLGRQPNTQTPDLLVDGERIGLRLMRLDGARSSPALDYKELCGERRAREAEEEDRILYVAMTRAREQVLLSGGVDFSRWPGLRQAPTAISWLGPTLSTELPALVQAADGPVHDLSIDTPRGSVVVRCRLNAPSTVGDVLRLERVGGERTTAEPVIDEEESSAEPVVEAEPSAGTTVGEQLSIYADGAPLSIREGAAVDTIANQVREGEQGETLSYTSLSELERCGYRYYLERVLGLPEDRSASRTPPARAGRDGRDRLEARARGTLIHRLMETLDFTRPRPVSPQEVSDVARELGMRAPALECAEIAELIVAARASEPAARVVGASSVRREHPFAFPAGPGLPLISGVIDLLASEADGARLVLDYKSDRIGVAIDLEALVEREYGAQRLLYALAVLRGGAASVEIVHWFLERPREWTSVRYTAGERAGLERLLAARIERAAAGGFAVSPSPHRGLCLTCPGRAGLCSWDETQTLRADPQHRGVEEDPIAVDA
jgi:ATP-dependent helicase/nuclease subunit A